MKHTPSETTEQSPKRMRGTPLGFINKTEAAHLLGCTIRSVDNFMKTKRIPYYKFARPVYFKAAEILKAVEASKVC